MYLKCGRKKSGNANFLSSEKPPPNKKWALISEVHLTTREYGIIARLVALDGLYGLANLASSFFVLQVWVFIYSIFF